MIKRLNSKYNHSWCVVQDATDNIEILHAAEANITYLRVSFEIIPFLFESFDLCSRPDDFIVTFNDVIATCYHDVLPDAGVIWQNQIPYDGGGISKQETRQIELFYPSRATYPLPWTSSYPTIRPQFRVSIRRGSLSSDPLPSAQMRVTIQDTTNGAGGEILKLMIDINATFDNITVAHQKWSEILPKNLTGDFFTVTEVDVL